MYDKYYRIVTTLQKRLRRYATKTTRTQCEIFTLIFENALSLTLERIIRRPCRQHGADCIRDAGEQRTAAAAAAAATAAATPGWTRAGRYWSERRAERLAPDGRPIGVAAVHQSASDRLGCCCCCCPDVVIKPAASPMPAALPEKHSASLHRSDCTLHRCAFPLHYARAHCRLSMTTQFRSTS